MKDILDSPNTAVLGRYLRKSAIVLMTYACCLAGMMGLFYLSSRIEEGDNQLFVSISFIGLLLIFLIAIPLGLVFIVKSYKRKEGSSITRLVHLVIHLIFAILAIMFLAIFVMDVLHLGL